ncbi:MAG: tRNA (adenosine(37)-N6)-dimethylallyltransferase MiaA [Acidobacteriota bacterium]
MLPRREFVTLHPVKRPPRLWVIVGPTASGKSALALDLAERNGGEIVNCDSMQVMRRLRVGTAKPGDEEMARVPHHLYDVVEPDEEFSAGAYMIRARAVCREIAGRDRIPVVVGGTGLYIRALLEGLFAGPGRREDLRKRLNRLAERYGVERLHRLLRRVDPASAERIRRRDQVRIVRALEVYFATGRPISELQPSREPLQGFRVLKLGLEPPRPDLYDRINRRVEAMFAGGIQQEVRQLLAQGFPPSARAFTALGYLQALAYVLGDSSLEAAVDETQRATRRYARRQLIWFRKDPQIRWIRRFGDDPAAVAEAERIIQESGHDAV